MTEDEKQDQLYQALLSLVSQYMDEFDMTYVSAIGALELMKVGLACEAFGVDGEEGDEDEGDCWKITIDD